MPASASALAPTASESVDTFEALEIPERLLIWGCRTWAACSRSRICPVSELQEVFARFGVVEAVASLDALLCATARTAIRTIEVRCPRCPNLSDDELCLLQAAAAAQHRDFESARTHLQRWLPGPVANWALGPACGLGALFEDAGLVLPVRLEPDGLADAGQHVRRPCTLH
jgi:hypothetical protein